tara:strand:+ start:188 stop:823 length:636 start_codon:yes stop_codon:yes gene_type:complete
MNNYKIEIIEDFLSEDDFNSLCSINFESNFENEVKIFHNRINKNNEIVESCLEADLIKRLHNNYHKKALEILKKLSPEKVALYDYSDFTIVNTGKNFQSSFHDDTPDKILSGVIYLKPEKNTGTIFSDFKSGKDSEIVDWKPNKAVFFSRKERTTWHAYKGNGESNRVALVYNLYTKDIKETFKIEKKNYFIGNLRYKINPYLFRYFKFTI